MLELQGTRTSDADLGRIAWLNAGTRRSEIVVSRIDEDTSTKMAFSTSNAGSMGTRMTIAKDGDVGIGTATPGYTLEVDGTSASAIAPSYVVANESSGTFKMAIGVQNSPGVAQEAFVGTLGNTDFKIMANSAFVGRITTTGRLLIGAGGVPEESIQAEGAIMSTGTNVTSSTAGTNRAIMDLTSGGARLGHFRGATAAGSGSVKIYSDSVERMIITSTGLNKINSSASGDHNAYQKTGTYTKTSTGSTTAMTIVKVGHTHAVNYTVTAKIWRNAS